MHILEETVALFPKYSHDLNQDFWQTSSQHTINLNHLKKIYREIHSKTSCLYNYLHKSRKLIKDPFYLILLIFYTIFFFVNFSHTSFVWKFVTKFTTYIKFCNSFDILTSFCRNIIQQIHYVVIIILMQSYLVYLNELNGEIC